ncbi:hypothetical protein KHO57_gp124 [Mycobacterium phage Phabba]|uniref:Uncharacterized protein n=1 Tax=Mycobacterium phage Phabba TaxID=2027899 RepID=A0A249XSZ9_9CAUD|nr:hypothetical protein KHO57_gp124 [Mycobacterium phage Phabba]ASZ74780.1 hypothetical protein SEA_PHABBA_243 [Mycobacterium phage Phabba]
MSRRSRLVFETEAQRHTNLQTFQKPEGMSWEEWGDHTRPGYWDAECHWYDGEHLPNRTGHCNGACYHLHQPWVYQLWHDRRTWWLVWPLILWIELSEWVKEKRSD